jgi:hypothetical protein
MLNETRLAVLVDPLPLPQVKAYGLNTALFDTGRGKCLIYDLYLAWVLGEYQDVFTTGKVPGQLLEVIEEMRHNSARIKLTASNYALSYTGVQGVARCVDAVWNVEGRRSQVLPNLVHDYNTITRRFDPFTAANPETWAAAAKGMKDLYTEVTKGLDRKSAMDTRTGLISESSPISKPVLPKPRVKTEGEGKERKD